MKKQDLCNQVEKSKVRKQELCDLNQELQRQLNRPMNTNQTSILENCNEADLKSLTAIYEKLVEECTAKARKVELLETRNSQTAYWKKYKD